MTYEEIWACRGTACSSKMNAVRLDPSVFYFQARHQLGQKTTMCQLACVLFEINQNLLGKQALPQTIRSFLSE